MKKLFFLLSAISLLACNSTPEEGQAAADAQIIEAGAHLNYYGAEITEDGAVSSTELVAQMQNQDTLQIKVKTTILETCKKKGCWMNVKLGEADEMMVRFKDYGFFVPVSGADGKTTIMEGIVFNDTIDVETRRHYASDAGKDSTEIMAITEPSTILAFEATGVIIKD